MGKRRSGRRAQPELFARSTRPTIPIEPNHRLMLLADETDWVELETRAEEIRRGKVKNAAGRPPHMRANLGAMMLKATRDMTWREVEDQVRHYAPARYLCGLTETEWTPDFTTVHDFAVLMGEDGVKLINEYVVKWAVKEKLADPSVVVGDTTAQEAAIPYPNEMGLMAAFMTTVAAASKKGGEALKQFLRKCAKDFKTAKERVREYRLFAKNRTKAAKDKMVGGMVALSERVNAQLGKALAATHRATSRQGQLAKAKLEQLHQTLERLAPQIRYWLKSGFVAANKVISLHIPELYSIVRGKVGKTVEFGLSWGFTRLRGGFLLARMAKHKGELQDTRFAVDAVRDQVTLFGKAPRKYGYDRGGWSAKSVTTLKGLGVKEVGLAPQGKAESPVSEVVRRRLSRERALIEGGIGAVKSSRYNFNRPRARLTAMMGVAGQLAVLGFNLNKLVRAFAGRRQMAVVG